MLKQIAYHKVTTGNEAQDIALNGITTNNPHLIIVNNVTVTSAGIFDIFINKSGSKDSTSDIGISWQKLEDDGSFQEFGNAMGNQTMIRFTDSMGSSNDGVCNATMMCYEMQSTSNYKYFTMNVSSTTSGGSLVGYQQGAIKSTTDACDGFTFNTNSSGGGFADGSTFALYEVV